MDNQFELVVAVVNAGFSGEVMSAAKSVGARGGTVIRAKGTASKENEAFFGITIQPEKEMVLIIVPKEIKDDVLHAIYKEVGLSTKGQGIAFSVPVEDAVGISSPKESDNRIGD